MLLRIDSPSLRHTACSRCCVFVCLFHFKPASHLLTPPAAKQLCLEFRAIWRTSGRLPAFASMPSRPASSKHNSVNCFGKTRLPLRRRCSAFLWEGWAILKKSQASLRFSSAAMPATSRGKRLSLVEACKLHGCDAIDLLAVFGRVKPRARLHSAMRLCCSCVVWENSLARRKELETMCALQNNEERIDTRETVTLNLFARTVHHLTKEAA